MQKTSLYAQEFGSKEYYLIDSVDLSTYTEQDIQLLEESLECYHEKKSDTAKIQCIGVICYGLMHADWMRYQEFQYNSLKQILSSDNDETIKQYVKPNYAGANSNMGYIAFNRGDMVLALDYYFESLRINEELGDQQSIASDYNNIAHVYEEQKDYQSGLDYYKKTGEIFSQMILDGDSSEKLLFFLGSTYNNIAYNYSEKYSEKTEVVVSDLFISKEIALSYYDSALVLQKLVDSPDGIATVYNNRAYIYKELMTYFQDSILDSDSASFYREESLIEYEKAEKIFRELGSVEGLTNCLSNQSELFFSIQNFERARETGLEAYQFAKQINYVKYIKQSAHQLANLFESTHDYKEAFFYFKEYSELKDSLASEETYLNLVKKDEQYKYEKKTFADSLIKAEELKLKDVEIEAEKAVAAKREVQIWYLIIGLISLVLFAIFIYNRFLVTKKQKEIINDQKKSVENQKNQIEQQHEELEEVHKEISDSIKYAERLQLAILPPVEDLRKNLKNGFVVFQPKDVVSGDFYWMQKVEETVLFAAADCTGHGVPGAMVSVVCSNALNRTVNEFGITQPNQILEKTRELVIKTFARSGKNVKDGMDIALCSLTGKKLIYAGANNPLWIMRRSKFISDEIKEVRSTVVDGEYGIVEQKATKQPVGLYEGMKPFEQKEVELFEGDFLYIFTDGFADQFGGERNKKLMYKPFKKLLLSIRQLSMEEQKKELESFFNSWRGENEQVDDVCVIGVRT